MARLRVRIELNRGGVGVPLHKLASVVKEAQAFFEMLAQDVGIEKNRGEWLAFDLDNGSLNFTAEYVGPVTADQVRAFYAAFDGVTSLRRGTIAQFTRIAEAIGEDELVGFGLYQSDQEPEPSEWRCLSRRDALRISDEIRILQGAAGEPLPESHLKAVIDADRATRIFKERHERGAAASDQSKWSSFVRAVESNLANRISRLETQVENHSGAIRDLREASAVTEESFRNLLSTVEKFCGQATNQLERLSPPQPQLLSAPPPPSFTAPRQPPSRSRWKLWVVIAIALCGITGAAFWLWFPWGGRSAHDTSSATGTPPQETANLPAASDTTLVPPPSAQPGASGANAAGTANSATSAAAPARQPKQPAATPPESSSAVMHIDVEAREPAWVSITDADGKTLLEQTLQPNDVRSLEVTKGATLRTGNAGALMLRLNGKDVGSLGPVGKIRDVEFKNGTFRIRTPAAGTGSDSAE